MSEIIIKDPPEPSANLSAETETEEQKAVRPERTLSLNFRQSAAVGDAMIQEQYNLMKYWIEAMEGKTLPLGTNIDTEFEKILQLKSAERCTEASIDVIRYLFEKYPELFDNMMLLTAYASKKHPFADERYNFHTYFLVKGKDGTYYAGSPANHKAITSANQSTDSSLTRLLSSRDLREIIDQIQKVDGGEWPTVDFIENAVATEYKQPSYTNLDTTSSFIKVYELTKEGENAYSKINIYAV